MARPPAPVLGCVALLVLLAGCTGSGTPDRPAASASATPTPLSAYDASGVAVARADFCDLVPDVAVRRALGDQDGTATSYGEGDEAEVVPGVRDTAGEFDCTWTAADGTVARAWVFAPPVPRERARRLVTGTRRQDGCRVVRSAAFGDPTVATVCRGEGGVRTAAYAGLFVDAWLSCSVTGTTPVPQLRERAGAWCVAVAQAADTRSAGSSG